MKVLNSGPEEVTIAQVAVDDAFWNASFTPSDTLKRFEQGMVHIPYPWVQGDPHEIKLITSNGLIFTGEVAAAAATPEANGETFRAIRIDRLLCRGYSCRAWPVVVSISYVDSQSGACMPFSH